MKLRQFTASQRNRKSLNKERRLALWKQAHGRCWYCGGEIPKTWFVLEHVEPFSRGGADGQRNLVVSCHPCDKAKGAMNLEEFRSKRGVEKFYGEERRPMGANRLACQPGRGELRRARRQEQRQYWRRQIGYRMVRMGDAFKNGG